MRALVIEDEHRIANALKRGLQQERYAVDVAYTGTTGYDLALSEEYDIILLDVMLPEMDGFTICRKLRDQQVHTPILLLTAKGQTTDTITGLDAGADDYLTKPFAFTELLARMRALTRRPKKTSSPKLVVGDLVLVPSEFSTARAGKAIKLSNKEFALLEYLMRHPKQIVSKQQIIAHVWNYDADILPNTVEVYIRNLRKKIDHRFPEQPALLHTVRGFGYKISN